MDIKLPKLGEGADSGTVVNVLVKEGDQIKKEQPILELESEKAVATIPASEAGTVEKVHVEPGQKISAGQLILTLGGGGAPQKESAAPAEESKPAAKQQTQARPAAESHETVAVASSIVDVSGVALDEISDSVPMPAASPSVRFVAAQFGLDLRRVSAMTGGNRVTAEDLKHYLETVQKLAAKSSKSTQAPAAKSAPGPSTAESIDFSQWGPVLKKPLSQLRKVIARRMTEHWQTIPHVTQFDSVDMTNILALRKKHLAAYEAKSVKLTVTPFVLKAVVAALKQHRIFNSSLDEAAGEVVLKEYYHLGLAVDTEAGLYVPVIRDVDKKDMLTLANEVTELAAKARDRKLTADEMKGGTFSISNQGAFGGGHFTPIVNKPEVAILGLGRSTDQAIVRDGKVAVRPMMPVALSYDHRVIDGGSAARFIVDLVKSFETFSEETVAI